MGSRGLCLCRRALAKQLAAVGELYQSKRSFNIIGFEATQPGLRVFIKNQCTWINGESYPAFHWTDSIGPFACIASVNGGGYWWMTRAIEHETTEMIGDPTGRGREIVDSVAQYFGVIYDGTFSFDYDALIASPFVDFLLPPKAAKHAWFSDYLAQIPLK